MAFHEQSFANRFGKLGDEAESVFEQVWQDGWVRYGLNRPPLHIASLPERIRHTPDYLTSKNFVEVKGIGRDETIKLKVAEFNCMHYWNQLHPLLLFVWSSHRKAWSVAALPFLQEAIDLGNAQLGLFHDGRAYFALSASLLTSWVELGDA